MTINYIVNSIKFKHPDGHDFYIKPLIANNGDIELGYFGIRAGADYAESNTALLKKIMIEFGSIFLFPSGHYYFSEPIDLSSKQLSIKGTSMTYSSDMNTLGNTFLHFENLEDGQAAITCTTGTLSDFVIVGNKNYNSYTVNRDNMYVDKDNMEIITNTKNTIGITGGNNLQINNVNSQFFRYGIYTTTGNIQMHNVVFKHCINGLSIQNDTKVVGVYGFDVQTLVEVRGDISSVTQIRGDSVKHLAKVIDGSDIYLSDLDADFCIGSIVCLGNSDGWHTIKNISIRDMHGRSNTYYAIKDSDSEHSSSELTTNNLEFLPMITVFPRTKIYGGIIDIKRNPLGLNPIDGSSEYKIKQNIILCGGETSSVSGIVINDITNEEITEVKKELTLSNLSTMFNTLSTNGDAIFIRFNRLYANYIYQQFASGGKKALKSFTFKEITE